MLMLMSSKDRVQTVNARGVGSRSTHMNIPIGAFKSQFHFRYKHMLYSLQLTFTLDVLTSLFDIYSVRYKTSLLFYQQDHNMISLKTNQIQ